MAKCPYLGLQEDPNTVYEFASEGNFCHHASPAAPPTFAHQNSFCLFDKHHTCPIFLQAERKPLPYEVAYSGKQRRLRENIVYSSVGALFLLLAVALAAVIAMLGNLSSVSAIPEGTITIKTRTPTAVATSSPVQTDFANPTAPPIITQNSPAVGCTPPEGWIIYYVIPGDTVYRLSLIFGISETALARANCMDNNFLRPGDLIYVPSFITTSTGTTTPTFTMPPKPTSTVRIIPFYSPTPTKEVENQPPTAVPPTATSLPTATQLPIDTPVPPTPTDLPTPTFPPLPTDTPPPPTDLPPTPVPPQP